MKRVIPILAILLLITSLMAQVNMPANGSVAIPDDQMGMLENPAANGLSDGMTFSALWHRNESTWKENYSLIWNFEGIGYSMIVNEIDDYNHALYLGSNLGSSKLLRNIYLGGSWNWMNDKFEDGNYKVGTIMRPHPFFSLGATADFLYDAVNEEYLDPDYRFGIGIRPFLKSPLYDKVEFFADFGYYDLNRNDPLADEDRGISSPIVGANLKLLEGLKLSGSYNIEDEVTGINFSMSIGTFTAGSRTELNDDTNYGYDYISINEKYIPSLLEKNGSKAYKMTLDKPIVDARESMNIGPIILIDKKNMTLTQFKNKLDMIAQDETIGAVLFMNPNFPASMARKQEIAQYINQFKQESGKQVISYFDNISNSGYFFAALVSDKIYLNKMGGIDLKGMAIQMPYFKELLDTLGIEFTNLRSHPYKTAGNNLTEKQMTEKERESYSTVFGDIYNEFIKGIEGARGDVIECTIEAVDNGPYFNAEDCLKKGLVDEILYESELPKALKEQFKYTSITSETNERIETDWVEDSESKIMVINATGNIIMGKGKPGSSIGAESYAKAIQKARKDPTVKAIVLRVDSGGGSAQASDIIAHEVKLCKEGKDAKPVVVSMCGVAASGGYYISAYADKIFAEPATITGSIGVIGLLPNFEGLYEKIKVNWSMIKYGEHADLGATNRKMTEDEKEMLKGMIENTYDIFIDVVAEGRNMSTEDVKNIAQGRIWTGNQALKNGLIDQLGSLEDTIAEAAKLANIKNEIDLVQYPSAKEGITVEIDMPEIPFAGTYLPKGAKAITDAVQMLDQYKNEKVLYLTPFMYDMNE
ncbi:MAG: signal peptide peptidase SppA [Candidatus Cloacimonetes bacterium]|nr:signal peptide peptidase SppA [Candidatus Cloacimonadota bacterium]